ncbi:MAG: hypothetical protein IJZ21_04045, partial [Clostridia bacterium]|nr:hypothetical protein [Clostridia bacterium]
MINWGYLWDNFVNQVFRLEGYKTILEGLQNTLIIALGGFLIGLVLGIILAIMQLLPDGKVTKILKKLSKL